MKKRLARKHLIFVVVCSTFFAIIATGVQLLTDYRRDVQAIHEDLSIIERSHLPTIVSARYDLDDEQLNLVLKGIVRLRDIQYAEVVEERIGRPLIVAAAGDSSSRKDISRAYPLVHESDGRSVTLGHLSVHADLDNVKAKLWDRLVVIVVSNTAKTLLVAFCILWIIQMLTVRYLNQIAAFASRLDIDSLDRKLSLIRKSFGRHSKDEIDEIVDAINLMIERIQRDVSKINAAMATQQALNAQLAAKNVQLNAEIAERTQAEAAVRESEARFRSLVDSVPDGIVVFDAEGTIRMWNNGARTIFDFEAEEIIGRPVARLIADGLESPPLEILTRLSASTAPNYTFVRDTGVLQGIKKSGAVFPLELSLCSWQAGQARLFAAITRDVTDRQNLQERIRQSQKLEAIGNLASGIAHDFNNILYPVVGWAEILMEDLPSGSSEHESVEEILKAALRGSDLVQQILAFSRKSKQHKKPVRVQQILQEALRLSRSTIPADIEIHQDFQNDCGPVMADPVQIHQVIMNLVTNAYHAVEATQGCISVSLSEIEAKSGTAGEQALEPGRYALMTVSDTGCGIPPAVIDKIFDPYFTTKEQGKGTGLGLATVYGIVKEHQGEVTVDSKRGSGATFKVYLPVIALNHDTRPARPASTDETGTEQVLLVDDEASIVRFASQMLERLGYQVAAYTSSSAALDAFAADPHRFDLVISDMTMPQMTGEQLARALLTIRPATPIIILTGFSERCNRHDLEKIGVKGFAMKPIQKLEMSRLIRKVLAKPPV